MADKQKFIVEGIAKIDNVLDGIKKIQTGLGGLKVPDNLQKQFESLYKKAIDQGDKAKKALSSGFETKGSVKEYTSALQGISTIYSQILEKTKGLKVDKDFLSINFASLEQANKELERLEGELKAVKDEAKNAKNNAQKVFTGVANYYGNTKNYKNPFKEWGEAADALKRNDIPGVKAALDALEQKFQGKNTGSDVWAKRHEAFVKLQNAFAGYEQQLSNVNVVEQQVATQQQVVNTEIDAAAKTFDPLVELMDKAARESEEFANSEGKAASSAQQLNSELEHFKNKAAYFFGLGNAINLFKRAVRSAYDTVKDLDAVMTETAVVTNFSVGDMWTKLPEYTQRANELGVTIHDTYEAATLFYQQGLKTNQVIEISNETLKMARIAGLDAATASDRMTNALRGFNMELDKTNAQRVNDVYSKLAAITASNTDEISTAMTKVASLAHNANMEFETTAAFLAQIIESTRESAETAGTALKTVVARFSEVKKLYSKGELMGQDEEGGEIDVNKVSTALRSAGINLNEYLTGAKGLDDIFVELAGKWDSLDAVQQRYIATMAAGSRQQSRFIALMSDYKRTVQLVDAANTANGASQEQYEKTLDSLQTKLARLKNAWNEFILGLANSDVIKGAVDRLTDLITVINNLIKAVSNKNAGVKMVATFFTAFATFKMGSKLVGKNSGFSKFLGSFIGKSGAEVVSMKGGELAKLFYSSLADKLANPQKHNFKGLQNLSKYFLPVNNKGFFDNLYNNFNFDFNVGDDKLEQFYATVGQGLDNGTLTVGKFNQALKDCGQNIEITKDNADQLGITMEDENSIINNNVGSMRLLSAASVGLGVILIGVGDKFEKMEGPAKNWGTVIKGLGAGLLAFGTIMSVYLPLQAQLMAKGVTSAIASIPIVGWIAALISVLITLGTVIYNIAKNDSFEAKLKRSQEAARSAAQAAEDAKDAYEKLNETLKSLDDKNNAIEEATKGTKEWRDAIKEVNDAVLELMNSYDGVIEIERGENGALIIKNRKEIEDRAANNALISQGAARVGKIRSYEDEENKRVKEFQYGHYKAYSSRDGGYYDPVGQVIYDNINNLNELQSKGDKDIKELLKQTYAYKNTTLPIGFDFDKAIKEIRNYIKETEDSARAIETERTAFSSTVLQNANVDEDLRQYANGFITDDYVKNLIKENQKTYEKEPKENLQNKYAEAHNTTWAKMIGNNPELEKMTENQMRDYLATEDALEQANIQIKAFTNNISKLDEAEKALYAGQEGASLTQNQIDKLTSLSYDPTNLYNKLGGKDSFGSFENFIKQFNTNLELAANRFDSSKFSKELTSKIESGLTEDLSSSAYKGIMDNLWSVYISSGEEGVFEIKDQILKITKGMDSKNLNGFINSLNSIDWTTTNSIHTLSNLAEEYGASEDAVKELENQIAKLNNAATQVDLTKVTEQLKSLLGLSKKINSGEQGRSFTEEQKNNLVAAGMDASKFQYNIETGSYDYIGDKIQDVVDAINNQTDEMFGIEQLKKDVASGEAAAEALSNSSSKDEAAIIQDYINKAGENSKINQEALDDAIKEAQNGSYTKLGSLIEKIQNEKNNLQDNQKKLDTAQNEKQVMRNQLNYGFINAENYAKNGDELSLKALKTQLSSSGLPEELKEKLLTGMDNGWAQDWGVYGKKANARMAGNIVDTFDQAKANGISTEDLNAYAEALKRVEGLQDAEADKLYALALAEAKYNAGMKSLVSSYNDWSKLIDRKNGNFKIPEPDTSAFKTYTKMKADVEKMLNSSKKIPDAFFEAKGNAELLEKAVKQDKKAIAELSTKLAKLNIGDFEDDELNKQVDAYLKKIQNDMPNFKIGAEFNAGSAELELAKLLAQSGKTVDEINKIMGNLGVNLEWEEKEMSYSEASEGNTTGYREIVKEDGTKTKVPINGETASDNETKVKVPMPKKATVAKRSKVNPPKTKKKSKGSGGGKKAKAKKERWENPYDELYNLQEKINESLRKREALERRYQKLLKQEQSQLSDIRKSYYDQIKQIRTEANLQKELEAGRRRQINNIGKETYVDSNGKVKTFDQMGVTKYAKYNFETGEIEMDWAGIQALEGSKNVEKGKAVEAYVSKLEELVQSYEGVRDKLWELEDKIEEFREAAIDSYLSFEDRVMEALVNHYQKEIDSYQAMSDAIDKVNNEVISSLREQIDLSRQIRDNTEKEEDISKKENRLAYLQRDTSGANDLEILSLQKELKDAREGYSDDLVDQAIDKMQDDADKASEQRQRQIETMQAQLDIAKETGALWQEVYDLMLAAAGSEIFSKDSDLAKLLRDGEAFKSLSNIGQSKWWEEVGKAFREAMVGRDESEDKFKRDADNNGTIANTGTSKAINDIAESNTQADVTADTYERTDKEAYGAALAITTNYGKNHGGWGKTLAERESNLKEKGFNPTEVTDLVRTLAAEKKAWDAAQAKKKKKNRKAWNWKNNPFGITSLTAYTMSKFKTGGLADSTGPAWLDGTRSHPELVLNAQDTRNFIALKDILASLMNPQNKNNTAAAGNVYLDIDINADIGSDYDVDRLASRIKKQIFDEGQYRNINSINFLR